MSRIEEQKLFHGWATASIVLPPQALTSIPESHSFPELSVIDPYMGLDLAISKRPAELMEVFSPTGRPVGDHYFRAYPLVRFLPSEITRILCELWLHAAVIRYCELWGAFTVEKFVRGYRGTVHLSIWIDHMLQGDAKRIDRASLKHRQDNKWTLADPQAAFPHIRRWSSQAIASARKFAWKYASSRELENKQE